MVDEKSMREKRKRVGGGGELGGGGTHLNLKTEDRKVFSYSFNGSFAAVREKISPGRVDRDD